METLDQIIDEYKSKLAALKQSERAKYEQRIWGIYTSKNKPELERRKWFSVNFGGTEYEYETRASLLLAGKDLWDRIDAGMRIGAAVNIFRDAKKIAALGEKSLAESISESLKNWDCIQTKHVLKSRASADISNRSNIIEFKAKLRDMVIEHTESLIHNADQYDTKEITEELVEWINEGLDTFKRRVYNLNKETKETNLYVKIGKTRFCQSLDLLGLRQSEFVFGKAIDLKKANKAKLNRVKYLHPDKNNGSREKEEEYRNVNEAYLLLEKYQEQFRRN